MASSVIPLPQQIYFERGDIWGASFYDYLISRPNNTVTVRSFYTLHQDDAPSDASNQALTTAIFIANGDDNNFRKIILMNERKIYYGFNNYGSISWIKLGGA